MRFFKAGPLINFTAAESVTMRLQALMTAKLQRLPDGLSCWLPAEHCISRVSPSHLVSLKQI